jgi:hypothetical protein
MKELVKFEQKIGGDGGKVGGALGVDGSDFVAQVQARFPMAAALEPAFKVVDGLVDKIEQWIPGDQKAMAAVLKAEALEQLLKLLS